MSQFENLEFMQVDGVGQYNIPEIRGIKQCPNMKHWVEFDYAMRTTKVRKKTGIHFFEYDCKFTRTWYQPNKYVDLLEQFGCVVQPDFSVYADFPKAVRIYNKYRNHWLARYWQMNGITVIPQIRWCFEEDDDWMFDGYPKHSVVAVSNIGMMKDKENREYFRRGYMKMLEILEPTEILLFARTLEDYPGNVHWIKYVMEKEEQR